MPFACTFSGNAEHFGFIEMMMLIYLILLMMSSVYGERHDITTHSFVVKTLNLCYGRHFSDSEPNGIDSIPTHTDMICLMEVTLQCLIQRWQACTHKQITTAVTYEPLLPPKPCYFTNLPIYQMSDTSITIQTFPQFRVNLTFMEFRLLTNFVCCRCHMIQVSTLYSTILREKLTRNNNLVKILQIV